MSQVIEVPARKLAQVRQMSESTVVNSMQSKLKAENPVLAMGAWLASAEILIPALNEALDTEKLPEIDVSLLDANLATIDADLGSLAKGADEASKEIDAKIEALKAERAEARKPFDELATSSVEHRAKVLADREEALKPQFEAIQALKAKIVAQVTDGVDEATKAARVEGVETFLHITAPCMAGIKSAPKVGSTGTGSGTAKATSVTITKNGVSQSFDSLSDAYKAIYLAVNGKPTTYGISAKSFLAFTEKHHYTVS